MSKGKNLKGLWVTPLVFFAVLFYWPMVKITSLGFVGDWLKRISNHRTLDIAWFTIWQAAISVAICLLFGLPGAYILYRRRFPGQKFLRALITVPFMLPTIVVGIGFTAFRNSSVLGNSAIPIIIAANVFMNYSLIVRTVGNAWANHLDPAIEDAAALDGAGRLRTFFSVVLPQMRKTVASASVLVFLYCATNFGLVLVLGDASTHTLETEIYTATTQNLDLTKAAGLVLIQSVLTILIFVGSQRISKSPMGMYATSASQARDSLDIRDAPAAIVSAIFISTLVLAPMFAVMAKSFQTGSRFGFTNYANLGGYGARDALSISVAQAAANSLRNALITVILSIGIGVLASYGLSRRNPTRQSRWLTRILEVFFQLPVGISSVVLGFGYLIAFNGAWFPLRSSWLVTPLAQTLFSIPLIIRIVTPALVSINNEILESAQTDAASAPQIWWFIEAPLIRNVIWIATGYAAIISIGEFGAANFLAYGDQSTLPTILYQLISRPGEQNYGMAMAASSLLILTGFLIVAAGQLFERSQKDRSMTA